MSHIYLNPAPYDPQNLNGCPGHLLHVDLIYRNLLLASYHVTTPTKATQQNSPQI